MHHSKRVARIMDPKLPEATDLLRAAQPWRSGTHSCDRASVRLRVALELG